MALDRLTKIDGGGISTTSDYRVGIITATKFIGPIEGSITSTDANFTGNVTIGGTLTYEDVTNIDSVGLITARNGIEVGARPGVGASISVDGNAVFSGIVTASSFSGIDSDKISEGNTEVETIDTGSDGHIKFTTEGSERLRITSDGKIGINSTAPNTRLDVIHSSASRTWTPGSSVISMFERSGNSRITIVGTSFSEIDFGDANDDNAGYIRYEHSDNSMSFRTNTDERLRITSGGSIGIGTDNPQQDVHILRSQLSRVRIESTNTGYNSDVIFQNPDGLLGVVGYNATLDSINIDSRGGTNGVTVTRTGVEKVRIDSSGNIGLGTNTIENFGGGHVTLEVAGSTTSQGGVFKTATSDSAGTGSSGTEMIMFTDNTKGAINVVSSDPLTFSTANTEKLRITSNGAVIVAGTTAYSDGTFGEAKLQFNTKTGNHIGACSVADSTNSITHVLFKNPNGAIASVGTHNSDFIALTANVERLRITSDGKVGINESPAIAQFQVKSAQLGGTSGNTQEVVRLHSPDVSNTTSYRFTNYRTSNGTSHVTSEMRFRRHVDATDMGYFGLGDGYASIGYGTAERLRIDSSGHLKHTGLRSGNSQNKLAILSAPSYNTSEEDVIIYQVENESGSNQLSIGAGTGSLNAMTALSFRTASAVNTLGGTERLRIDSNGASTFKAKMNVDYTVTGNDYIAFFRNQNANCYGIQIQQPSSANSGYPLIACTNASGGSHFRVDSGGNVYANSGTGTEKLAYFCRAWASITQTGTQTIRGSKGITSISDQGTGYTRVNLTNAQPDKNYSISVTGTAGNTSAGYASLDTLGFGGQQANEPTTTYFNFRGCKNSDSAGYDHPWITVAVFG